MPLACIALAIFAVQALFTTGGTFRFGAGDDYYDQLGEAFLGGQLYLPTQPTPQLLALADPYDPTANASLALHDASLYRGHYYLYFGPFPGVVHAAVRVLTQRSVPDGPVQMASASLATVCFWLIVERFRRKHALRVQAWVTLLLTVGFGVGGSMLYLVARPAIYHEAVLVAMACTFAALAALSSAWSEGVLGARAVLVCGVLVGCAIAARVTYLAYAVAMGVCVLAWAALGRACWRTALGRFAAFAAPLIVIVGLLLLYNWARFGSIFETGLSYQLAGPSLSGGVNPMTCGGNLGSFFQLYLASFPRLQLHYPWVPFASGPSPVWPVWFPREWMVPAAGEITIEPPLVSPFLLAPVSLLGLTAPLAFVWGVSLGRSLLLAAIPTLGGALLMVPFLSCANGVNARYFGDISPALTLLGSLVFVAALDRAIRSGSRARTLVAAYGAFSLLVTLVVGAVLGLAAFRYTYEAQADAVGSVTEDVLVGLHLARPTSYVDTFPEDLRDRGLASSGVYEDGWVRQDSSFTLVQPSSDSSVVVRGVLSFDQATPVPPTELRVFVDGEQVGEQTLVGGDFDVEVRAPPGAGKRRIDLQFSRVQQLPPPDKREAAALLRYVGFQPL